MENLLTVSEVKLAYKTKQKASERPKVFSSKTSYDILRNCFDPDTIEYRESFKVLLLNRCNKVLGVMNVSEGGINNVLVDIRLILQAALLGNASGLIIAHNHPSGVLESSLDDDTLTARVKNACQIMDISLLDHIIISSESYYSYADNGKL